MASLPLGPGSAHRHARRCRRVLIPVAALLVAAVPATVRAQNIRSDFPCVDGYVRTITIADGTAYVGGNFNVIGPATGGAALIDTTTGLALKPYPMVNGKVYAIGADGSGGYYIGGLFTAVGGQARQNLAHLDAAGNLDAWAPATDSTVRAIAVNGGTIYVGGDFSNAGGQTRHHAAAFDASANLLAWNPNVTGGTNTRVNALAVTTLSHFPFTVTVYLAGLFTSVQSTSRNCGAAVDANAALLAWNPNCSDEVKAMVVGGTVVYLGGMFGSLAGQARPYLASVDASSGALSSWTPAPDFFVDALAFSSGIVYVSGGFGHIGGQSRVLAGAVDATTGLATSWNPAPDQPIQTFAIGAGVLYAGGDFRRIGGQERYFVAALDFTTGTVSGWSPSANNSVRALAVNGGTVAAGGLMTSLGGQVRRSVAAVDIGTGAITSWNPNLHGGDAYTIAVVGKTVYVGGTFDTVGVVLRSNVAGVNRTTGAPTAWNPAPDSRVTACVAGGSSVYLGGQFTTFDGQPRSRLAAVDTSTGAVTAWNPGANNEVQALAVGGGAVYAGGLFTILGGHARSHLGAIDAASGVATAWSPSPDGGVDAIALGNGRIYVGGNFTNIGAKFNRYDLAAFTASSDTALDFATNNKPDGTVTAIAVEGGSVYVGGSFDRLGLTSRADLAAVDATTGDLLPWDPALQGVPFALAADVGVFVGGLFSGVGPYPTSNLAEIFDPANAVEPGTSAATVLRAMPNPSRGEVRLTLGLPRSSTAEVRIFDLEGREIRDLDAGAWSATVVWDGRDAAGHAVAPGIYLVRARSGVEQRSARIVRLR
ncbi:MAG TPA: FlgD immunoglobulin-like domain containing protein [Gemmatimonadales bacterium]|nr:FlgD immunoglobulin-like domain containing protein [Gemmatimonadales bacterium]